MAFANLHVFGNWKFFDFPYTLLVPGMLDPLPVLRTGTYKLYQEKRSYLVFDRGPVKTHELAHLGLELVIRRSNAYYSFNNNKNDPFL